MLRFLWNNILSVCWWCCYHLQINWTVNLSRQGLTIFRNFLMILVDLNHILLQINERILLFQSFRKWIHLLHLILHLLINLWINGLDRILLYRLVDLDFSERTLLWRCLVKLNEAAILLNQNWVVEFNLDWSFLLSNAHLRFLIDLVYVLLRDLDRIWNLTIISLTLFRIISCTIELSNGNRGVFVLRHVDITCFHYEALEYCIRLICGILEVQTSVDVYWRWSVINELINVLILFTFLTFLRKLRWFTTFTSL